MIRIDLRRLMGNSDNSPTTTTGEFDLIEKCGSCGQVVPPDSELMVSSLAGRDQKVLVERFYELLFESRPDLRRLFPDDMSEQNSRLGAALLALATYFDPNDGEKMTTLYHQLQTMGWAHKRFVPAPGLSEYADVRSALVRALVSVDVRDIQLEAWGRAYDYAAGVMIATQATARVSPRKARNSSSA